MTIELTPLAGLTVIHPNVFADERGFFMEVYRQDQLRAEGIDAQFVQCSHSSSKAGILRGLHFQWDKPLGKLIRVIRGRAYVVAVDIRKKSSTLGQWFGIELSYENKKELWAPPGFASGFCMVNEDAPTSGRSDGWSDSVQTSESASIEHRGGADVEYQYTAIYNPKGESNIIWNDPAIGIEWPIEHPILSPRDGGAGTLADWLARSESDLL